MSSLTAEASRPRPTRRGGSSGSLRARRGVLTPRRFDVGGLLPCPPVTPLVLIAAGIVAVAVGSLLLRSYGPRVRVGRLLAVTPSVTIAEAREMASSGARRYVRVDGRLDADEVFPDEHQRPLVYRRRRIEARLRGGWRVIDEQRGIGGVSRSRGHGRGRRGPGRDRRRPRDPCPRVGRDGRRGHRAAHVAARGGHAASGCGSSSSPRSSTRSSSACPCRAGTGRSG